LVASESATQLVTDVGGADVVELRQPMRDNGSHSPNHGVEGGNCYGEGRVNEGPTCCTGKPYWGAAKKACDINQYGAPPIDGSKEDGQVGCTRKPYWAAAKKAYDVDQYGAPPTDESKDGQAGVPAAAPARALATAAVAQGPAMPEAVHTGAPTSKGPTAPATGPTGALTLAARRRRPVGGWPATVPTAVLAGAPMAATAAKERAAPTAGPAGVLTPAAMKGVSAEAWGRVTAVPGGAPAATTTPTTHSQDAAAAA
jgi:hypothetical protein